LFNEFDIEAGAGSECNYDYVAVYDGPNSSSPLIGMYCNTTGNPGTINSSGGVITIVHFADQAVNGSGFEIKWECVQVTSPPIADFTSEIISNCEGIVSFYDQSSNVPTSWKWNFGDGKSSDVNNPTHVYDQSGIYTVSLIVSNGIGSDTITYENYISITVPEILSFKSDTVCEGQSAKISAVVLQYIPIKGLEEFGPS